MKIISGGQTGVDRAALDVALDLKLPCGGACPAGRLAEDGPIPQRYPLVELEQSDYRVRTRRNVKDAHGTLIVHRGNLTGGSLLTRQICERLKRPHLCIDLAQTSPEEGAVEIAEFVEGHFIAILNVAGPRASTWRGAAEATARLLRLWLKSRDHS